MKTAWSCIFLLSLLVHPNLASADAWPEIPAPPHAKLEWVADSMRVNGVPTRVMRFESERSAVEIVAYYRSYWSGGYDTPPSVKAVGAATVVAQRNGPYLMTVKVRSKDDRTSSGLIATSQVIGVKIARDPGELPLMPGAQVRSVVESDDPGQHSREVVVQMAQPPASVARFYESSLTEHGWRVLDETEAPSSAGHAAGKFVELGRDGNEYQLSVAEAPGGRGSTLVANLVTKDTGPDRH